MWKVGYSSILSSTTNYSFQYRCIAVPNDLDGGGGELRTSELTEALEAEFASGVLWDEWGIDANIIVCSLAWI